MSSNLQIATEVQVEQEHHVTENGVETYTDVSVPDRIDAVTERLAEWLWDEFGIAAEDEGLTVVDPSESIEE